MQVLKIDILDGRGVIEIAVETLVDAERIRKFTADAAGSFYSQSAWDEREACACICDDADKSTHPAELADRIRARSNAEITGRQKRSF